ncbi:MAG: FkbM family methyltransferase [Selenomonadaceae bacterium]|nr:FkbM family methyltransferase [Selenomonadaceae bacterium]
MKKFAPNLKLLAFEPDAENFKLLRINTILNGLEDSTTLVNCGLGNKFDEMTMYIDFSNPGYNSVIEFEERKNHTETVKIIPLDAYLAENKISASEIKYIWIDTEGFEPQVLLGAKNLLKENSFPIFMECNLRAWDKSGIFEEMMALLAEQYSHFILLDRNGAVTFHSLEALRMLERPNNPFGQIGDIFLIKRGTIN